MDISEVSLAVVQIIRLLVGKEVASLVRDALFALLLEEAKRGLGSGRHLARLFQFLLEVAS